MSEMTPEPTSQDLQLAPPPPAPAAASPQMSPNFTRRLIAAIVAAVILATGGGVGAGWALAGFISSRSHPTQAHVQTVQPIQQSTSSGSSNLDINTITRKVSPAIVDINTVIQTSAARPRPAPAMILTSTGEVLTNNHVVDGSTSIRS